MRIIVFFCIMLFVTTASAQKQDDDVIDFRPTVLQAVKKTFQNPKRNQVFEDSNKGMVWITYRKKKQDCKVWIYNARYDLVEVVTIDTSLRITRLMYCNPYPSVEHYLRSVPIMAMCM